MYDDTKRFVFHRTNIYNEQWLKQMEMNATHRDEQKRDVLLFLRWEHVETSFLV